MYIILFSLGTTIVLISQIVKNKDEKAKEAAAQESKRVADARAQDLANQIADGQKAEAERAKRANLAASAMLEVLTANQNLKSEYERRIALIDSAEESRRGEVTEQQKAKPLPNTELDAAMAAAIENAPKAVAQKIDNLRRIEEAENAAAAKALSINGKVKGNFDVMIAAVLQVLREADEKGYFQIGSIPEPHFPKQIVGSSHQVTANLLPGYVNGQNYMSFRFESGEEMQIFLNPGVVSSPPEKGGLKLDRADSDGIQYPEIYIQAQTKEKRGSVSGQVRFFGASNRYEAYGNWYPEWKEINERYAHNGEALSAHVMVTLLGRLRSENAIEQLPKP